MLPFAEGKKQKGQHHTDSRRATPRTPIIVIKAWVLEKQAEDSQRETEKRSATRASIATYVMEKRGANVV